MNSYFIKTKIGIFPSDWKIISLNENLNFMTDYVANGSFQSLRSNVSVSDKINYAYFVRLYDLRRGLGHSSQKYIDKPSFDFLKKSSLKKNDILISNIGSVGETYLISSVDYPSSLGPNMILLRCNDKTDPEFLFYFLQSQVGKKSISSAMAGSTQPKINKTDLKKITSILPPLPEQRKIAEILSEIEKLKQCCIDEIKKIDLVEKSLWSQLFLEEENDEWRKIIVSDIGTVIRGASPRPKGDPRYYGGNVPRLMVADVTRDGKKVMPKIDFLTEEGAKLSRPVPAGTLTIVCSGVVGVPSILSVPACIHDGFLAIKDISKSCLTEYLYYYFKPLQSRLDSSATHGGIFTNLTTEILKNFPVMLPSLRKQKEICEILNTIDCHRDLLLKKKEKIQFLFNSVSSELLSGRKKVSV